MFQKREVQAEKNEIELKPVSKKEKKNGRLKEVAFYLGLIAILGATVIIKGSSPLSLGGYGAFTVLTGSMESEIPKGSLVITRHIDPEELKVGDDITYMANETTTITHRIIGITENYKGTGQRAFETKGIMNKEADEMLVPSVNVIGKVVFHNLILGRTITFIGKNWPLLIFLLVLLISFIEIMKKIMRKEEDLNVRVDVKKP